MSGKSAYLSMEFVRFCYGRVRGRLRPGYRAGILPGTGVAIAYVLLVVFYQDAVAAPAGSPLAMGRYGTTTDFLLWRISGALPAVLAFGATLGAVRTGRGAGGDRWCRLRAAVATVLTPLCLGLLVGGLVGLGFLIASMGDGVDGAFVGLLIFGLSLASALEHALVVLPFLASGAAIAVGIEAAFTRAKHR